MSTYLLHLVPWYVWLGLVAVVLVIALVPGVFTLVLGFAKLAREAWIILPERVKLGIGCVALLGALVVLHFWDVREKVNAAVAANDKSWTAKLAAEREAQAKQVAAIKAMQQQVITRTVIEYRDRIKIVKEKSDEVIAAIPELLPVGHSPLLSGRVRVIHDAAAVGNLPDDPLGAARTAEPVETAALLTTVAENYRECSVTSERLIALQKLVTSLEGVKQ